MRPLRSLVIYILVVFVGGALLAPLLHWAAVALSGSHTTQIPFHRFVDRSLLGLALLGMWPLLKSLGAVSWRDIGLAGPQRRPQLWLSGFALGFGSLAVIAGIVILAHGRSFDASLKAGVLGQKLLGAALSALVVSILEELLFRGAVFGSLRRIWNWRAALMVSSMIYAMVHFLQKAEITGLIRWYSGLELLPRMLAGFADWPTVFPGFLNLTLAGILLGRAYQRTGNLYYSMGLHAGWIFWLKSYGTITREVAGAPVWLFGSHKLIDGWLALVVLALAFLVPAGAPGGPPNSPGQPKTSG